MRVATWNLERSAISRKWRMAPQLAQILSVKADVWVLTETHAAFTIPGYLALPSTPMGSRYHDLESAATIWVRDSWRVHPIQVRQPDLVTCAYVDADAGSFLMYGTIIPWLGDGRSEGIQHGARQRAAVSIQVSEWRSLMSEHPEVPLIVAGDFNITLHDGNRGYGNRAARMALRQGLDSSSLKCLTAIDFRASGALSRDNVDHICVWTGIQSSEAFSWWAVSEDGRQLSDHNGVYVDLTI